MLFSGLPYKIFRIFGTNDTTNYALWRWNFQELRVALCFHSILIFLKVQKYLACKWESSKMECWGGIILIVRSFIRFFLILFFQFIHNHDILNLQRIHCSIKRR